MDDDFSICKFVYNIQRTATFEYSDGAIIRYNKFYDAINKIVQKILVKKQSNKNKNNNQNTNYVINRKTNKFHLKDNGCNSFKNVESKYINETTATEKDLIKAGLTACEKCKKIKQF